MTKFRPSFSQLLFWASPHRMHWEEKVDSVKKKFPPGDFKDPFRSGREITGKIIVRLFQSTRMNFTQAESRARLLEQHGTLLKTCTLVQFYNSELPALARDRNFWLLLINAPGGAEGRVYDCTYEPLRELLYLSSGLQQQEFCVVDKKYGGLLYYRLDRSRDSATIYRIGNTDMLSG